MKKTAFFLSILLCFSVMLISCKNENVNEGGEAVATDTVVPLDISSLDVSEYIVLGKYKDMTIEYKLSQGEKSDILWKTIVDNTTVKKYPEQQVDYYYNQIKAKYIYLANSNNETYEKVLEYVGETEESILAEAREMTLDDLVTAAIFELEGVELTEKEKSDNYDVYVRIFTEMYGYSEEYVKSNLTDELFDMMRYDKMMEKLVMMNEFVVLE